MALSGANIVESIYNDRVLLLESNTEMRRIYEEQLEFSGYEVHCATSSAEAKNVLAYVPVNLIVCNEFFDDGKNALEYLTALRKHSIHTSILFLTDDEDRVWSQIPDDDMLIQTFPIPHDLDDFFKADINQFVSIVAMFLDNMKCALIVSDSTSERIDIENMLIANNYRVCSVNSGKPGLESILKSIQTPQKVNLIIMDIINRYYPGFMFLEDLAKNDIALPTIILSTAELSLEKLEQKTHYHIAKIVPKLNVETKLLAAVQEIMSTSG